MAGKRARFPNEITLAVDGPPSIIPTPFTAKAKLKETWYDYLARNGLKLPIADQVVIRTYNGSKPCDKARGWSAELNEPVEQLIYKFERIKNRYSVRLAFKSRLRSPSPRAPIPSSSAASTSTPTHHGHRVRRGCHVILTRASVKLQGSARAPARAPHNLQSGPRGGLVYRTQTSSVTPSPRQRQPRRQGPSFVIPRSGLEGPSSENLYRKPRYTPGIVNGSRRGSTQNRYGTRLNGLIASGRVIGQGGSRVGMRGPPQQNSGLGLVARGEGVGDRQGNLATINDLAQVKVELEVEESEENGSGGGEEEGEGGANEEEMEVNPFGLSDMEEGEDTLSSTTEMTAEETELRREGIDVEDVKTKAEERLEKFDNSYFLKMRKEFETLKKNNHWMKSVNRAPLACFMFMQEILKR